MSTAFTIVNFFIQIMIFTFMYDQFIEPRWCYLLRLSMFTMVMAGIYLEFNFMPEHTNNTLSTVLRIIVIYILTLMAYRGSFIRKTLIFLLEIVLDIVTELISCLLAWRIYNLEMPYPTPVVLAPEALSMAKVICLDIMFLLTFIVIIVFKRKDLASKTSLRLLIIMLFFCLIHLAFLVIGYCVYRFKEYEINDWLNMTLQLMLFSLIIFHYFSTLRISRLEKQEARYKIVTAEIERDRRYFELADSKFDEISRIRHDIQNQLATVRLLMETEDGSNEAEKMINSISQHLDQI